MRSSPVATITLLCMTVSLGHCLEDETGYSAAEDYQDDAIAIDVVDSNASCPTDQLLRMHDICHFDSGDVPCIRLRCCNDFVHLAGRCIHKSIDPCSLKLCEQSCEVRGDKVWCTCKPGFRFSVDNYRRRIQPYCLDVNECATNNGGCEQHCVNDPGGYHCECSLPYILAANGRCQRPAPVPMAIVEPLPLIRASSRCFAPCDTVTRLARKVRQLSDQLQTMQAAVKKITEDPVLGEHGDERFSEGTFPYRVLDSIAPLEGGYCRCERGPRGPPGPPGMEGPKGDLGQRGPRGPRGPTGSLDFMLLLVNELRHDIRNLEAKVYTEGEQPERYDIKKAWRRQRKQEKLDQERRSEQELEVYTAPPIIVTGAPIVPVEISPNGLTGEVTHDEETTEWRLKTESETFEVTPTSSDVEEQLRQLNLLANKTGSDDEEEEDLGDYDYSFY